jgi:hypothetical protein
LGVVERSFLVRAGAGGASTTAATFVGSSTTAGAFFGSGVAFAAVTAGLGDAGAAAAGALFQPVHARGSGFVSQKDFGAAAAFACVVVEAEDDRDFAGLAALAGAAAAFVGAGGVSQNDPLLAACCDRTGTAKPKLKTPTSIIVRRMARSLRHTAGSDPGTRPVPRRNGQTRIRAVGHPGKQGIDQARDGLECDQVIFSPQPSALGPRPSALSLQFSVALSSSGQPSAFKKRIASFPVGAT